MMQHRKDDEEPLLRSVALQNASSILAARQRAEQELLRAKQALEAKTAELAQSLSMMRATLESTTDGILVTDESGNVTGYNARYTQMWHLPADAMDGCTHHHLLRTTSAQFAQPHAFLERIDAIYRTSPPESYDLLELADGRLYERHSKSQYVEQRKVGRVWSFRDITERRRAEQALRDETRMLELLNTTGTTLASKLDLAALMQTITDAATQLSGAAFGAFLQNANSAAGDGYALYTLSGASRASFERFGNPRVTTLFAPTFRGDGVIRCDDVVKDSRYGTLAPHHGIPEGHVEVHSYLAVPVVSRSGDVIGGLFFGHSSCGVFTERTERMIVSVAAQAAVAIDNARLYEAAQRAADERKELLESERAARTAAERMSAMKDEFLATLSHELRTPLSAILGWAHVLRRSHPSAADVDKGLDAIERNARVQTQLIEDLLDMSRITSGKVRLDIQLIEPISFVEAAVETVRPAAEAKGIRIEKLLDPQAGPISGDPSRLQQIVWNLLSNAIKFTPKDGKVQVLLQRVNSHIEIGVADTGVGIKPEFLAHVFERFRQSDASTTRNFGGLGLGLSIVRSLVELHGGTVRADSAGEDRGATFTVCLPLSVMRRSGFDELRLHPKAAPTVSLTFAVDLSDVKVLVVDDDDDARALIERVLEDCRAEVTTADGADEALRVFQQNKPDLLVCDIGMPNVDGYELLRRIRALAGGGGARTPAIALTAFARSEDRTRALRAGFRVHVSKPVEPAELIATVASVVGRASSET